MTPLRVALDARPAAGVLTGVGLAVVRLAEYLSQCDIECHLLYDRTPAYVLDNPRIHSIVIHASGVGRARWEQNQLPSALRQLRVDLYHATWNYGVPLRSPCPAVLTVHDVIPLVMPGAFPSNTAGRISWIKHWIQVTIATAKARLIMADSHSTAEDLIRLLPHMARSKIRIVPLGFDPPSTTAMSKSAIVACISKYQIEQPYLIYIGGMDRRKNLKGLVRAYHQLRQRRNGVPAMVIVGEKIAQYVEIEALVHQLNLNASVIFTGYAPRQDLWSLLAGSEMLIYPSFYEGFGLPPLEAMACGTPVIISNVSSLPEVVGDAALLINPYDETQLANAIERLLDDAALQTELRRRGLVCAREFSWQKYASCVIEIYRELIDKG